MRITVRRVLDVLAVGGAMIGSACIASNSGVAVTAMGYAFFLASSIASVAILKITNGANSLLFCNFYFTIINVVGLIRYGFI